MEKVLLQNDHVTLVPFTLRDAPSLFALVERNREYLEKWLSWVDKIHSEKDIEVVIANWLMREERGEMQNFGIRYDGMLVGVISFNYINREYRKAEIGYWLAENEQGKGIMTTACSLLIDYGFRRLHLHRLEINCASPNKKSARIAKRLGFTHESRFRDAGFHQGKYYDYDYFGLLESEWKKSHPGNLIH